MIELSSMIRPRHRQVDDVMTASVVTADPLTPYKEVTRLLAEHQISGLPVLRAGWQVVGVVSESDLLAAQDQAARPLLAGDLMTAPPVTIGPDATLAAAVRLMTARGVRRLPVTGADCQLIGIVSRRDLLSVFLRPDPDIACDVGLVLAGMSAASVAVSVRHGVVTLTGVPADLVAEVRGIDGVVEVICTTPLDWTFRD